MDEASIPYDDEDLKNINIDPDNIDVIKLTKEELTVAEPEGFKDTEMHTYANMHLTKVGWYTGLLQGGNPHL